MSMRLPLTLDAQARQQHGLLTRKDWTAAGLTAAAWYRSLGGPLIAMAPNVARVAGSATTTEQRILTAVLANPDAVASHRSAAFLWGIAIDGDRPVDVITSSRTRGTEIDGVVFHRPRDRGQLRPVNRRGIPTTTAVRTLVDLGAVAPGVVAAALESLLIARKVTVNAVSRSLADHRGPGRAGVNALDSALRELALGAKPPDSVLETAMGRLLARSGIAEFVFHARVLGYELDFGSVEHRVGIEVDGWAFHSGPAKSEADRARDANLAAAGWVVLRFTWNHVTKRPAWVADRIARTLEHRVTVRAL